ncbi:hypothetical protein PFMALIP_05945, partial [Plasmodium falciparum MaliPS096_E11]
MKEVMDNFNRQTQQRFHEYDERMVEKRMQCKEQCDKEIQKIILKDKIDKELTEKFATLHTDIQNDAIPTCICEKSIADKVEKNYMKCTQNLGGIVAPSSGVLAGIAELGLSAWKTTALKTAIAAAEQAGAVAGKAAGDAAGAAEVVQLIASKFSIKPLGTQTLQTAINVTNYTNESHITQAVFMQYRWSCTPRGPGAITLPRAVPAAREPICNTVETLVFAQGKVVERSSLEDSIKSVVNQIVTKAETAASTETAKVTASETETLKATNIAAVEATYASGQTAIIASIAAIVVIVLVM